MSDIGLMQTQPQIVSQKVEQMKEVINTYFVVTLDLIQAQKIYMQVIEKYASDKTANPYTMFSNNFMPKYSQAEMATDSEEISKLEQKLNELERTHHALLSQIKSSFKELAASLTSFNEAALNEIYTNKEKISNAISMH